MVNAYYKVSLSNWKQFKSGVCHGQIVAINNTLYVPLQ